MITDAILNVLLALPLLLLNALPAIDINLSDSPIDKVLNYFTMFNAILPISDAFIILGIFLVLHNFSFIWSLLLRIKSFIPTMGD